MKKYLNLSTYRDPHVRNIMNLGMKIEDHGTIINEKGQIEECFVMRYNDRNYMIKTQDDTIREVVTLTHFTERTVR